jgi:hypothetical protein
MSKGYIAHFYPESDASQRYKAGKILEVIGPVFTTYAEAARQINDELDDIVVQSLPVAPYIIEVEPHTHGYQISEVYELHFDDTGRESNPRKPSAKMTPVGQLVGKGKNAVVDMADLRGIETGERRQRSVSEAAQDYGSFMGRYAPKGVPASKIASAFRQRVTPKRVIEERKSLSEVRHEAVKKFSTAINRDLKTHGVTASMERSAAKIEATRDALKQGQITKVEAAGVLALESKKQRVLRILQDYCPKVSVSPDDATEAEEILTKTYDAVVEVLGGGSEGADAASAVIEKVVEDYTGEQVEVTRYGAETAAEPAEEVAPRRRGRPPRAAVEPPAEAEAPRRRGRPPRAAVEPPAEAEAPRRRGRPPRAAVEPPAEAEAAAGPFHPPSGGREDRALSGKRFAAFDEARTIVGLPFQWAVDALASSSFTLEQLYDALEDRNFHSENLVLQSLAVPHRQDLWKQATELVKAHHRAGHLSPELQQERNELYEKIQKCLHQEKALSGLPEASVVVDAPPPPINPATAPEPVIVAEPSVDAGYDEDDEESLPSARKHKRDVRINLVLPLDVVKQIDVMSPDIFDAELNDDWHWLIKGFQANTIRQGSTRDGTVWPYYTWKDILGFENPNFSVELVYDKELDSVSVETAIDAAILPNGIKWYCELVDEYRRKEALALLAILVDDQELHEAVLAEDADLDLIQRDLMREADRVRMASDVYCATENNVKSGEDKEYALFATYSGTIGDAVRSCNLSSPLFEYEAPPVELPPRIIPSEAPAPVLVPELPPRIIPSEAPAPVRAQSAKAQAALDQEIRLRRGSKNGFNVYETMTVRQMLDTLLAEGGKVQSVHFKTPKLSYVAFEKMEPKQYEAFQQKIREQGLKPEYEITMPDGTIYPINKTGFDYADRGEPLLIKFGFGWGSSGFGSEELKEAAKRVTREKYPAIFAREATVSAPASVVPELPPRIIPSEAPAPVFVPEPEPVRVAPPRVVPEPEPVRIAPPRVMPEPEPVRIAPPRVVAAPPRPSGPPSRALLDMIENGRNRLRTVIEEVRELSQDNELPNPILRMFDEAERELRQAAYFHKDEQPAAKVAGMNELAARLEEAVTNFRNPRRVAPPSAPPRIVVTPPAPVPEPVIDEAELQEEAMERMSQRLASAEDSLLSRLQSGRSRSSIEETPVNTPSRESRAAAPRAERPAAPPAPRATRPVAPPAPRAERPVAPPAPPAPSESELQEAALAQLQERLSSAEDSLLAKLAALKR